ncbi:hypothetical protein C5976_21955 [Cronobacter sakazakii]|nr:hypothetical protein [Cronobacter sakazakii]EGT4398999.1 hypothetical protein [Cronobacter malonaticus]EGT4415084.1 hypothetical protein [Cronobacter malonaticus]EGT5651917.1 hypothetical protein [Cronobacter sakazakii]EGT5746894.1 hypothetical protein [Cronobacter sakazakii]
MHIATTLCLELFPKIKAIHLDISVPVAHTNWASMLDSTTSNQTNRPQLIQFSRAKRLLFVIEAHESPIIKGLLMD